MSLVIYLSCKHQCFPVICLEFTLSKNPCKAFRKKRPLHAFARLFSTYINIYLPFLLLSNFSNFFLNDPNLQQNRVPSRERLRQSWQPRHLLMRLHYRQGNLECPAKINMVPSATACSLSICQKVRLSLHDFARFHVFDCFCVFFDVACYCPGSQSVHSLYFAFHLSNTGFSRPNCKVLQLQPSHNTKARRSQAVCLRRAAA